VQSIAVKHIKVRIWYKATGTATGYVLDVRGIGVPFSAGEANIYLLNGINNSHIYCIWIPF
jgi:hypothetical protein